MVQIIPRAKTGLEQFLEAMGPATQGIAEGFGAIAGAMNEKKKKQLEQERFQKENEAAKQYGIDLTDIYDPKMREKAFSEAILGKTAGQVKEREADLLPKMKSFADRLESENPNSPKHKLVADIYRSDLPSDEKSNLIKSMVGLDPFKVDQQNRLQMDSVLRRYKSRIKELDIEIKNLKFPNSADRDEMKRLKKQRDALSAERDELLDFRALNDIEEEEDFEEEEEPAKLKFNPKNPEHVRKFKQLDKKFKGDRNKVNAALAKEFSL